MPGRNVAGRNPLGRATGQTFHPFRWLAKTEPPFPEDLKTDGNRIPLTPAYLLVYGCDGSWEKQQSRADAAADLIKEGFEAAAIRHRNGPDLGGNPAQAGNAREQQV